MDPTLRDRLLLSIEGDRLALMCGAGLSMSAPTSLPSAATLAQECASRYEAVTGSSLPAEIGGDLERLSDHFLSIHRFRELLRFVSWDRFRRNPNLGHDAIADFLCCRAFELVLSTNYDTHIEAAALALGEDDFQASLDGVEADELTDRHRPLLKLHGCCQRDRRNTIWAHSQLDSNATIRERVDSSSGWLSGQLAGKDLIILGFWTDWSYLDDLLKRCVEGSEPRTVVVVDPAAESDLRARAPALWEWANQDGVDFFHVPAIGDDFLEELRVAFSRQFIRRAMADSRPTFAALFQAPVPPEFELSESQSAHDLYSLRRDLSGRGRRPVCSKRPDETVHLVAAYISALLRAGGELRGTSISISDHQIRVINCANLLLSNVKADFEDRLGASRDCDLAVCVGVVDDAAPGDLVRDGRKQTIVRGGWDGEWLTHDAARERLNL